MLLQGKVAVITGSASGMGRAAAKVFAAEGAKVVVSDIDDKEGAAVVKEIKGAGNEAAFCHTDCAKVSDLEKLVKFAVETYGKLNIYWHNAGIAGPGQIENTTEEGYDWQLAVHLKAGFFGAKFAIPEIAKAGGGSILFTSSGAGIKTNPFSPSYGAAKAGLINLTKGLALAVVKKNIRVNAIAPGWVKTSLGYKFSQRGTDYSEENVLKHVEASPMGRYIDTEEIAQAALFLVSDRASAITGVTLPVDGGMTAG